jgi:hypothetical protein
MNKIKTFWKKFVNFFFPKNDMQIIIDIVCSYYKINYKELLKKKGKGSYTSAFYRQVIIFLVRKYSLLFSPSKLAKLLHMTDGNITVNLNSFKNKLADPDNSTKLTQDLNVLEELIKEQLKIK